MLELPEYWSHIAETDSNKLLELYRSLVSEHVEATQLFDDEGRYVRRNQWNDSADGGIAHLMQSSNTLLAAIKLVADSTILRKSPDGMLVTDRQELVRCGQLGEPLRNSDPQIAEVVNDAAFLGAEITMRDPMGLYLDGLQSAGIATPDGVDAAELWFIDRGTPGHIVRATFRVPEDRGYALSDLTVNGLPLRFGGQIADKVRVRISAIAKPGSHQEPPQPCIP